MELPPPPRIKNSRLFVNSYHELYFKVFYKTPKNSPFYSFVKAMFCFCKISQVGKKRRGPRMKMFENQELFYSYLLYTVVSFINFVLSVEQQKMGGQ